jgi:hypothetical protein
MTREPSPVAAAKPARRSPAARERVPGSLQQPPAWTKPLSQPGDPGERRADASAAAMLGGAGQRPPTNGTGSASPAPHAWGAPTVEAKRADRGRPLRAQDRIFLESSFGTGVGPVLVHDDPAVAEWADATDARAVTVGSHVLFGTGEYRPATARCIALLVHALAHVEQGPGGASEPRPWRKPKAEVVLSEPEINPADAPGSRSSYGWRSSPGEWTRGRKCSPTA